MLDCYYGKAQTGAGTRKDELNWKQLADDLGLDRLFHGTLNVQFTVPFRPGASPLVYLPCDVSSGGRGPVPGYILPQEKGAPKTFIEIVSRHHIRAKLQALHFGSFVVEVVVRKG